MAIDSGSNKENEDSKRRSIRRFVKRPYILYPLIACAAPHVIYYFVPAVLLIAFIFGGLALALRKRKKHLLPLQFFSGLCIAYGAFVFVAVPDFLPIVVPEGRDLEWPAGESVSALSLPRGEWAAAVNYFSRVQIYDSDGRYLRGWFVPAMNCNFAVSAAPTTADGGTTQAALLVTIPLLDKELLYSPEGKLISEKEGVDYPYEPRGNFAKISLLLPWYKWPLTHKSNGWWLMIAGSLGIYAVEYLEKRNTKNTARST